ncbi:hypothetical protein L917_00344 [Phytophthora nicotianae]|uniref:Uncharacterized protein n=1 Tax=Phytophthora nicotianae TaxID=4792 RepID=W2M0Z0_PHYNI|nr:hypothetical protein L917_00344 [Phytophthora nicotianae]
MFRIGDVLFIKGDCSFLVLLAISLWVVTLSVHGGADVFVFASRACVTSGSVVDGSVRQNVLHEGCQLDSTKTKVRVTVHVEAASVELKGANQVEEVRVVKWRTKPTSGQCFCLVHGCLVSVEVLGWRGCAFHADSATQVVVR